jgi:tripartite-type tricarboxylate transporter receptor subunit TctC
MRKATSYARLVTTLAAALLLATLGATAPRAQNYPDKVVRLVVPFVPGSPVDVLARIVTQPLGARLGQPIVIENKPGAGTATATKAVAAATPDGYTLLMSGQTLAYLGLFYPDLGFDPLKAFAPVATLAGWSHVMVVNPAVPAKTVAELVAYAKAHPGKLTFGFGLGTSPQILGEYFKVVAGVDITSVPYRGGEQVRVDLLGGRIDLNFGPLGNVLPMIQAGKVRPIAVTSAKRLEELPDVPTMSESAYPQVGFDPDVWQAIVAPLGTPRPVITTLNGAVNEVLKLPEVKEGFAKLTFNPLAKSPEGFAAFLDAQGKAWPPVIKAANIRPQ